MVEQGRMNKVHLLLLSAAALAFSSCSLLPPKEVTRAQLFKPDVFTAMDYTELTNMQYYGADAEYDYFSRGSFRYKVKRSENAVPAAVRTEFTGWNNGRLYRGCLEDTFLGGKLLTNGGGAAARSALKAAAAQKLNTFLQNRAANQQ